MKTKILILIMCLACLATYAQQPRKRSGKKKPATTTRQQKVDTTSLSRTRSAQPAITDTSKRLANKSGKPFERPLDGYYTKTSILSAKVTPYPSLRESDVAYAKRV